MVMRINSCWIPVLAGLAVTSGSLRAQAPAAPRFEPLVSIKELMEKTITPATNQLWSAWEAPTTDEQWAAMEEAAVTLLAASNLTALGGTGPMDQSWVREPAWQAFDRAMIDAGEAALDASRKRDADALLAAGDQLLPPCEGCHQLFNPGVVNQD
jgi:cytochrome c556